jgi:quinol monooxygenase YgiN
MIVIAGTIDLTHPDQRDEAVSRSIPLQAATRADEAGCVAYVFGADAAVAGRIQVFELWADAGALEAHFKHPNFAGMRDILVDYEREPSHIRKYRIDAEAPVYDNDGRPTADF